MAEVLTCRNRAPAPPGKEDGWWKDEDPVVVMPDGHPWGTEERNLAKFDIVKFPGLSVEALAFLLEEIPEADRGPGNRGRRKFRLKKATKKIHDRKTGQERKP
jgi:hypothetical protein